MHTSAVNPAPELLAIGLNPAWQKTFFFQHLQPGAVNRAERVRSEASGKGINFAHAVQQAGGRAVVAQFAGGATGDQLRGDLDARGIPHLSISAAGATRVCNTLLSGDDQATTEIIEPSAEISPAEFAALRAAVLARLPYATALAICGTFPPGVPMGFAAELATVARRNGIPVQLDAYRGVAPVLEAGVEILKINATELRELAGLPDVAAAALEIVARYPATACLAVTDGAGAAQLFLHQDRAHFRLTLPPLPHLVNPIGAGDCTAGVFLLRLVQALASAAADSPSAVHRPLSAALLPATIAGAFREALACACASCLEERPATFDPTIAARLHAEITVTRTQ